jgi:PIN domain nuclease of toxin-antitoxin system
VGGELLSTPRAHRGVHALLVLDTHVWVWWLTRRDRVGRAALRALEKAARIGIPAISPWEVAMKCEAGKLQFDRPHELWIEQALAEDQRLELLPLTPRIAVLAAKLSWPHGDPADRMIVATAHAHQAVLATADERIHDSRLVQCVWD